MGGVTHGYPNPRDPKKNRHFEVVQHHDQDDDDDDDDFDENLDVCIRMY